jgi:hypothetical protein
MKMFDAARPTIYKVINEEKLRVKTGDLEELNTVLKVLLPSFHPLSELYPVNL